MKRSEHVWATVSGAADFLLHRSVSEKTKALPLMSSDHHKYDLILWLGSGEIPAILSQLYQTPVGFRSQEQTVSSQTPFRLVLIHFVSNHNPPNRNQVFCLVNNVCLIRTLSNVGCLTKLSNLCQGNDQEPNTPSTLLSELENSLRRTCWRTIISAALSQSDLCSRVVRQRPFFSERALGCLKGSERMKNIIHREESRKGTGVNVV